MNYSWHVDNIRILRHERKDNSAGAKVILDNIARLSTRNFKLMSAERKLELNDSIEERKQFFLTCFEFNMSTYCTNFLRWYDTHPDPSGRDLSDLPNYRTQIHVSV